MILRRRYLKLVLFLIIITILIYYFVSIIYSEEGDNFDPDVSNDRKVMVYEKMIAEYRRRLAHGDKTDNTYQKRPETQHIDCGRVLRSDKEYIKSLSGAHRIPLIEDPHLNMSCEAVRFRIVTDSGALKNLKSGVAFARIVYRDYEFIEKTVQMSYHPNNLFCFAIDNKAPPTFRKRIQKLGECFENVHVLPVTEQYDGNGHNNNLAHYNCMEAALKFPTWNYFIVQENHDIVIKSIYELERIYEIMGGANDVGIGPPMDERLRSWFRFDPKGLKLFRNESGIPSKVLETPMKTTKSYKQASLSRAAVEWMVRKVDVMEFINQWNQSGHGLDEQWLSTFQANSQLGMPGHFVHDCLEKGFTTDQVTRMTKWYEKGKKSECGTGTIRHSICIMGIEDLPSAAKMPNIMFNKVIPSFDYSIVECTAELLHNRTFLGQTDRELDEKYYGNMINVLYHKHHREPGYRLNCTPSYDVWQYKPLE